LPSGWKTITSTEAIPDRAKALYPDFAVLYPRRGIFVLKVKDWKIASR